MPRALPRFFPDFFAKRRKAVHGNPGKAQIRKRRRGSAVRTRARTENQARAMRFFLQCRAHCRVSSLTFLRSAEKRFTEIREAHIRKRRRGSAVRTRARTENQVRGSAVLFALPRFFPDFFAKRRKAVHGNPGKAQIRKRRRGSAVRTRSRTENRARGSAVLFALPRALPRFLSTFLWKAQTRRDRAARERGGRRAAAACDEGAPIYEKGASEQQPDAPLQAMQHYLVSASTLTTCWPS